MNDSPIKQAFDTFDLLTKCGVDEKTAWESAGKKFNDLTQDAQLTWKMNALLKAAKTEITNSMLHPGKSEIALESIPLTDPVYRGCTVADLPSAVATAIAKPYGTLGLDDCPMYGATESPWYIFQHSAVDFMRGKISRAMMRKMRQTAERLELAIGCIQWAGTVGVHDIPQFQAAFTSALILDKDATAELNGETIEIKPEDTKMPLDKSVLMQILDYAKRLFAGQGEIKSALEKPQGKSAAATYRKYPKDAEALDLLEAAAKKLATLRKKSPNTTHAEAVMSVLEEPDGRETKERKNLRLRRQCRVWHGAVKNGKRQNATATPPERLDPKARAATWEELYKKWGNKLSAYLNHPPAK